MEYISTLEFLQAAGCCSSGSSSAGGGNTIATAPHPSTFQPAENILLSLLMRGEVAKEAVLEAHKATLTAEFLPGLTKLHREHLASVAKKKMVSICYLGFDLKRRIIEFPKDEDFGIDFDGEYTVQQHKDKLEKELCLEKSGRIYLPGSKDVGGIKRKAMEEFKQLMVDNFHDLTLPDLAVVSEQNGDAGVAAEEESARLVIKASEGEGGFPKWTWNFSALDSGSKCRLEFSGLVHIERKRYQKNVDAHVIQFKAKRTILRYGNDCYTDCYGMDEREGAEEHFDEEFEYDRGDEKVLGYSLKDVGDINLKASDVVKDIIEENFGGMDDVDVLQEDQAGSNNGPDSKPVIIESCDEDGCKKWTWDFEAKDAEYGCDLNCEGAITIAQKFTANPKIPKVQRKRRKSATKAAPRRKIMRTNIVYH